MNKTAVLNWDYEKPTEPGLYLACYGDVETLSNTRPVKVIAVAGELLVNDGDDVTTINEWSDSFKWARLLVGSEAREFVEGNDGQPIRYRSSDR